ncbi:MAG TPA: phosphate ABC transporter permease PstA [Acetobacteraceae bacterium]|nr:phosphate ABC transporter permease PstA [Acetobacteraceae bacterium]
MPDATLADRAIVMRQARLHARISRRRAVSMLAWVLCGAALAALCLSIVWIIGLVLVRGIAALRPSLFTTVTQGTGGGLLNAIEGTCVLAFGTLLLVIPFGISAGIYAAEFRSSVWARVIRFLSDVLVGLPSIVLGYFGYVTMVEGLGWKFSVAAASITLAIICLPYVARTTEVALGEVPQSLREAAYAMGAGAGTVTLRISMRLAMPAVVTGVLLALAISVGETAPLLYTAGWSNYTWNGHLTGSPIGYLTYVIWAFINEPFAAAHALAYAAALLVTGMVLLISVASRMILLRAQRRM